MPSTTVRRCATTLLRFRYLLEKHALTQRIFEEINAHLAEKDLFMREDTIVDATIMASVPSTKNQANQHDPEMKQTKKGNQRYFGMKDHICVDAIIGLTYSLANTSAIFADVTMVRALVREDDNRVYGDASYTGMWKHLDEEKDASDSRCYVAAKRGALKKMDDSPMRMLLLAIEKAKSTIRTKVEHPSHVIKNIFFYRTVLRLSFQVQHRKRFRKLMLWLFSSISRTRNVPASLLLVWLLTERFTEALNEFFMVV